MRTVCFVAACVCLLPGGAWGAEVASLVAGLDSETFGERERAEKELREAGQAIVDQALDSSVLPVGAADAEIDRHFEKLASEVRAALQEKLYAQLDALAGFEARFRAKRVREGVERHRAERLRWVAKSFTKRLPAAEAEKVYGYTGGFREGTSWFDTKFGNNSPYTVTSIRILVRLTDKRTGKVTEREATLGTGQPPLAPGQSANWSVDTGMQRTSGDEFFWNTVAVYGLPPVADGPVAPLPE
jgi:hypothetical protein